MPVAVEVLHSDPRGLQGVLLRICRPRHSCLRVLGKIYLNPRKRERKKERLCPSAEPRYLREKGGFC